MKGMPSFAAGAPVNIASALVEMARQRPYAPAIYEPRARDRDGRRLYAHFTYAQLDERSDAIARGFEAIGIGRGVRTVLMVRPSLEFFALFFALFKAGAVPVLVDPGIGIKRLGRCLGEARPTAFVGIAPAQIARVVLGWARGTIVTRVTVGARLPGFGLSLADVIEAGKASQLDDGTHRVAPTIGAEMAAILFTSGSTGAPKGVVYEHRHFAAQVELIRDAYGIEPGEVDLPTFPPFALFDPALGMTTVIPDMDPTRPAKVDPENIFEAVRDFGVTNMFGSPALLDAVGRQGAARGVKLPTLRRVISAGAPVSPAVMARFLSLLPEGARVHTPYGATECLPVATIDSDGVLGDARAKTDTGAGVCVGRPLAHNDVRVIGVSDDVIERWDDTLEVLPGVIGEITVRGPTTTQRYDAREEATKRAKIDHGDGWRRHRMGDVGYFDEDGRLWFCGRLAHRVVTAEGTLYTVPCEMVFNAHPAVFRTALVGVERGGATAPVLCVEREKDARIDDATLFAELRALGSRHDITRGIDRFVVHPGFPVDIRHNAKIDRPALAQWAAGKVP